MRIREESVKESQYGLLENTCINLIKQVKKQVKNLPSFIDDVLENIDESVKCFESLDLELDYLNKFFRLFRFHEADDFSFN